MASTSADKDRALPGNDRRAEARYHLAGTVFWRKDGRSVKTPGYLLDASESSVSFLTSAGRPPVRGEELELLDPNECSQRCRVTRTAIHDDRRSLVVCRSVFHGAEGTPADSA